MLFHRPVNCSPLDTWSYLGFCSLIGLAAPPSPGFSIQTDSGLTCALFSSYPPPPLHLSQGFSESSLDQPHLEGLLTHRALGVTPAVSDSIGLRWNPNICISNQFQVMVMMLVLGLHLENHSLSQPGFRAMVLSLGYILESPGEPEHTGAWVPTPQRFWF